VTGKTRILVVDDDPRLRKTLADILHLKGYGEVAVARTGVEAVAAAAGGGIGLALIDLMLPDMDGIEVMARIKAVAPLTEAIILTGHASMDTAIAATGKGAFSYLLKPYQIDDLLLTIGHALDRHRAQEQILRLASYPRLNPNPVIEVTPAGEVTYLNPAADRAFPDLAAGGRTHPMLAGIEDLMTTLPRDGSVDTVREIELGAATYEQHVSYVREADLVRIQVLDITERTRAARLLARRETAQAAVARLGTIALTELDLSSLYSQAAVRVAQVLDVAHCLMLELESPRNALLLKAAMGWGDLSLLPGRIAVADGSAWQQILGCRQPVDPGSLQQAADDGGLGLFAPLGGMRAIALPIGTPESPVGILAVLAAAARELDSDETHFLQSVANILAAAVQRRRAEEDVSHLASTDSLTGIANRRAFIAILEREIERARRNHPALSLIMYDLDHFKRVNDDFGHDVGDTVLQTVTALVKRNLRGVDVIARWGGEEFMILVSDAEAGAARFVAEKCRLAIAGTPLDCAGTVTASFGVVTFRPGDDMMSLLKRVDDTLYAAKEGGRNRVEVAAEPITGTRTSL
jgi:diguanylate cyclase (GGDEF)-like protein